MKSWRMYKNQQDEWIPVKLIEIENFYSAWFEFPDGSVKQLCIFGFRDMTLKEQWNHLCTRIKTKIKGEYFNHE